MGAAVAVVGLVVGGLAAFGRDDDGVAQEPAPTSTSPVAAPTSVIVTTTTLPVGGVWGNAPTTQVAPTTSSVPQRSVLDFGAVPDDGRDDTAALRRALAAMAPGETLVVPGGTYRYSDVLVMETPGVRLVGRDGATLEAAVPSRQAIMVRADDVAVTDLRLTGATTRRFEAHEQHRVVVEQVARTLVQRVIIESGSAAGILVFGGTDYRILDNRVSGTLADGIHSTAGSRGGLVQGNVLEGVGDDCIAVVSYRKDGVVSRDIVIRDNECRDGDARGISVVGGEDVVIQANLVVRSRAAGVYLASEGSFDTYAPKRVRVVGNRLEGANTDARVDHGAIFIGGREGTAVAGGAPVSLVAEDITVLVNTVVDTIGGPAHVYVVNGANERLNLLGNSLSGKRAFELKLSRERYNLKANVLNGDLLGDQIGDAASLPA